LNLCGCVKAVSDTALQVWIWLRLVGHQFQKRIRICLDWIVEFIYWHLRLTVWESLTSSENSLWHTSAMLFAADESVIALAHRSPHLRSLGLYFCKNITDRANVFIGTKQSE
jgi:F-box and leucine-rich repeat protein 1 (S-phase kinase-associated protein 2)